MNKTIILVVILSAICISSCDVDVELHPTIQWDPICQDCHPDGDSEGNTENCTVCHPLDELSTDNHGDYFDGQPPVTP